MSHSTCRSLSIFDLDHTLLSVNSSFSFSLKLERKSLFHLPPALYCIWYYLRHQYFGLSIRDLHQYAFQSMFKGRRLQDLEHEAQFFIDSHLSTFLYQPALLRLRQAQLQNHQIVIMSSSPTFLVEPIAKKLGVDMWYGSIYRADGAGCLSEIQQIVEGQYKAQIVRDIQVEYQIPSTFTCAYSDSYLDLPLLEMAGKAVGVNPDRRLKEFCVKYGWEII